MCFITDPYHGGDTTPTREAIKILTAHGMGFNPLSKGGTRALHDIDLFRPDRDAYATTLTSLDDAFSLKWEATRPCLPTASSRSESSTCAASSRGSAWNPSWTSNTALT